MFANMCLTSGRASVFIHKSYMSIQPDTFTCNLHFRDDSRFCVEVRQVREDVGVLL